MSEFGSIKNGQKPESAENLNNESLAQFGVASPSDSRPANNEHNKASQPDSNA